MKKVLLATAVILFTARLSFGQACSCADVLSQVVWKTEHDYAGYIHKVKEKDSTAYSKLKMKLVREAKNASFKACYTLLEEYVDFFHDGHLYIGEFPGKQPDSLINGVKRYQVPGNYASALLKNRHRDSIEGIWNGGGGLQLAIVKAGPNKFYGVVRKTKAPRWEPGMVKLELEKVGDNRYNAALYRNDFAKIHFFGLEISKNTMFSFGVYRFAKTFPVNPETQYIDPDGPELPTVRALDQDNVLLTIPSALIDGRYLDSILVKNLTLVTTTPNLIIDVRGNGGGNYIWGDIYELANTIVKPEPKKPGDQFLLLASEDDADYVYKLGAYYRQQKDSAAMKFIDDEVAKIRANIGKMVGFSFYSAGPDTAKRTVYDKIKHVAVIMDKNVASAGEAFIIDLLETSSKVMLYGANTHGMIDYMQVNTLPVGACDWYYFGYPTYFAPDIKTNPRNPTGIKPDVDVPAGTPDWVEWVRKDLGKRKF
ncbi:MAG: hypothetical protein JSU01_01155 [Bacteroidetes bacterium]|nr:hypothetical protein [Bacteroidota bacterium]